MEEFAQHSGESLTGKGSLRGSILSEDNCQKDNANQMHPFQSSHFKFNSSLKNGDVDLNHSSVIHNHSYLNETKPSSKVFQESNLWNSIQGGNSFEVEQSWISPFRYQLDAEEICSKRKSIERETIRREEEIKFLKQNLLSEMFRQKYQEQSIQIMHLNNYGIFSSKEYYKLNKQFMMPYAYYLPFPLLQFREMKNKQLIKKIWIFWNNKRVIRNKLQIINNEKEIEKQSFLHYCIQQKQKVFQGWFLQCQKNKELLALRRQRVNIHAIFSSSPLEERGLSQNEQEESKQQQSQQDTKVNQYNKLDNQSCQITINNSNSYGNPYQSDNKPNFQNDTFLSNNKLQSTILQENILNSSIFNNKGISNLNGSALIKSDRSEGNYLQNNWIKQIEQARTIQNKDNLSNNKLEHQIDSPSISSQDYQGDPKQKLELFILKAYEKIDNFRRSTYQIQKEENISFNSNEDKNKGNNNLGFFSSDKIIQQQQQQQQQYQKNQINVHGFIEIQDNKKNPQISLTQKHIQKSYQEAALFLKTPAQQQEKICQSFVLDTSSYRKKERCQSMNNTISSYKLEKNEISNLEQSSSSVSRFKSSSKKLKEDRDKEQSFQITDKNLSLNLSRINFNYSSILNKSGFIDSLFNRKSLSKSKSQDKYLKEIEIRALQRKKTLESIKIRQQEWRKIKRSLEKEVQEKQAIKEREDYLQKYKEYQSIKRAQKNLKRSQSELNQIECSNMSKASQFNDFRIKKRVFNILDQIRHTQTQEKEEIANGKLSHQILSNTFSDLVRVKNSTSQQREKQLFQTAINFNQRQLGRKVFLKFQRIEILRNKQCQQFNKQREEILKRKAFQKLFTEMIQSKEEERNFEELATQFQRVKLQNSNKNWMGESQNYLNLIFPVAFGMLRNNCQFVNLISQIIVIISNYLM